MRLFNCQSCGQLVYFENHHCERCKHRLGYASDAFDMLALEPVGDDVWAPASAPARRLRFCENAELRGV